MLLILPESQLKTVPAQCMASPGPAGIQFEHDYFVQITFSCVIYKQSDKLRQPVSGRSYTGVAVMPQQQPS